MVNVSWMLEREKKEREGERARESETGKTGETESLGGEREKERRKTEIGSS